ncbi:MAG: ATP synthase F1 subunit gamma [Lachnospiraceae bacterium]
MASMRDIKRRRISIQSTQQITKAMKLVSTVKLQKARTRAENSKAYFDCMYKTITSMLAKAGNIEHPYLQLSASKKVGIVVVTSNRGLAGGYNSNVIKLVTGGEFNREDVRIYAVGSKGADSLAHKHYQVVQNYSELIEEPTYGDAQMIGKQLLEDFANGEIGEIYLAYTVFKNTVSHVPTLMKLLPVDPSELKTEDGVEESMSEVDKLTLMNFEPEEEEAVELLIPKYMTSILYGAFVEAVASENGARMQAMDSATSNAEEMIDDLALKYNRARQGAITQELTEIIAGSEALS